MFVCLESSFPKLLTVSKDHPTVLIEKIDRPSSVQDLTVPFDVPQIHILHTVRMVPMHDGVTPFSQQDCLAIGSVLPLQIVISHTRRWWDGDARSEYDGSHLDFKYEVQASPNDWTIGGQKKGHFRAKVSLLDYP